MASLKCKSCGTKNDYPEGAPSWMLTYGDMITLMLCFFVYLVSTLAESDGKFQEIIVSFKGAYDVLEAGQISGSGMIDSQEEQDKPQKNEQNRVLNKAKSREKEEVKSTNPEKFKKEHDYEEKNKEDAKQRRQEQIKLQQVAEEIQEELKRMGVDIMAVNEKRGMVLRMQDKVFFDSGNAKLRADAVPVLNKLAKVLSTMPNDIRIEGHTDDVPIGPSLKNRFPTNWELSALRAVTVLRYLANEGVDPLKLSALGYGKYRPLEREKLTLKQWREKNRRIDIILMRSSIQKK